MEARSWGHVLQSLGLGSCGSCPEVCKTVDDKEEVEPVVGLPVALPALSSKVGSRKALRQLQGLWFREDGELIAQIIDSLVIFEGNQVSRLSVLATNRFALEWEGREHVGTLEVDAQASLTWSDGDVWLRK